MDTHQIALAELIDKISTLDPICSIFAKGSIGRGNYRPDSDIDLFVVTWKYETIAVDLDWDFGRNLFNCDRGLEVRLDTGMYGDIQLDLHCRSPRNHVNLIMNGPVYSWGDIKVLYDPSGIASWGADCQKRLLEDNPEFERRLRRFHEDHQRWKQDKTVVREYETQLDFGASVDAAALVRNYLDFRSMSKKTFAPAEYSGSYFGP